MLPEVDREPTDSHAGGLICSVLAICDGPADDTVNVAATLGAAVAHAGAVTWLCKEHVDTENCGERKWMRKEYEKVGEDAS